MSNPENQTLIYVQDYSSTYIARGPMGKTSCTAGEQQAADRYVARWYGTNYRAIRAEQHDTHSRGNSSGNAGSIHKSAYIITKHSIHIQ